MEKGAFLTQQRDKELNNKLIWSDKLKFNQKLTTTTTSLSCSFIWIKKANVDC